jgi:hypothetical protein
MLVNVTNEQGNVNAALYSWDGGKVTVEPVVGAVVHTDGNGEGAAEGAAWQIRGESSWVDGAWDCESYWDHPYDGVKIRQTGRTIQSSSKVGRGVRVEITFVGDGEADVVTGGWLKVGSAY